MKMPIWILLIFSLISCKNKSEEAPKLVEDNQTASFEALPEDFKAFFDKFHSDSIYQINHIVFPLQGLPAEADSSLVAAGSFYFPKEGWVLHKPFNNQDGAFKRTFDTLGDNIIFENITISNETFGMQRRFAKMDTAWYLIYYQQMNKIK